MERKVGGLASGFVNLVVSTGSTQKGSVLDCPEKDGRNTGEKRETTPTYLPSYINIKSDRSGPPDDRLV